MPLDFERGYLVIVQNTGYDDHGDEGSKIKDLEYRHRANLIQELHGAYEQTVACGSTEPVN